jgi:dTDP-4-amino-4,6-dideoxygalactose transaminase
VQIPFHYFNREYEELKCQYIKALSNVGSKGNYILGTELENFEKEFAGYCGARYCIGVGNGLDALTFALLASDVKQGDEVIVPANTYIATFLAISRVGARPVPIEPDPLTYCINAEKIKEKVSYRTKVIMPVHLYGRPADMDIITELSEQLSLKVITDAAQAHGAKYKGKTIGGFGNAECFSFYPTKNLGAFGDGGAIVTNDKEMATKIRLLRNYGQEEKYVSAIKGFNSRLDELQSAFLRIKLKHLNDWNAKREAIAAAYNEAFSRIPVKTPEMNRDYSSNWYVYPIMVSERDKFIKHMESHYIKTAIHYPVPPHLQPAYSDLGFSEGSFPITESISRNIVSLPIDPFMNTEEMDYVIENVLNFYE